MIRAALLFALLTACTGAPTTPIDGGSGAISDGGWTVSEPDSQRDAAPVDEGSELDSDSLTLQLGTRDPFSHRADGKLIVIQGPQGGFHTEHSALVLGATADELHLALIWVEVSSGSAVLARAGWEFFDEQWVEADEGFVTDLPPLVFDTEPELESVELSSSIELTNGRMASFQQAVVLVAP